MRSIEKHVAAVSEYYNYSPSVNAQNGLLYLRCTGDFTYEPGYDLRRNSFDSFLAEVVLEGTMTFETEGRQYIAKKDDVILLDCYKPHRYFTDTGCRTLWVHFDGVSARAYYNWITNNNGCVFATRNVRKILRAIETIYEMLDSKGSVNEPEIALQLTTALTAMVEAADPSKSVSNNADAMEEVIYYINAHLEEELSIAKLAALASFSEYHFIRVFREAVGMTPRKYIIQVRMDHAKYLLKSTSLSVQEVGYKIGYASESMFCSSFKKSFGMTPSEYRADAVSA